MHLRLIADDLTGALDTAAQFVACTGPVRAFWTGVAAASLPPSAALDSGTRECGSVEAAAIAARLAAVLTPTAGVITFKKLDSLLRGHPAPELAAVLRTVPMQHCIVAPAFPFQGRITRGGVQYVCRPEGCGPVGEALGAALAHEGVTVTSARPGDPVPSGVSLWDAETDEDLRVVATAGLALGTPVLWCGTSGLAGALAGPQRPVSGALTRPVLGLFGSDHPVTVAQLFAAGWHRLCLPDGGEESAAAVTGRLAETGMALVGFDLPPGLSRPEAAMRIGREIEALTRRLAPPRTLVVAGGETLRTVCIVLGADHLEVQGQIMPGVPRAVIRGGRWDGTDVISKSGAFGQVGLLRRLVTADTLLNEELGG